MRKFALVRFAAIVGFAAMLAAPALADTTTAPSAKPTVDLACMQTAVDTRDTAVMSAFSTYTTSVTTALSARKDALKAAWGQTDVKTRRAAIRAAWKAWRESAASARKTLRAARLAAWKQYGTDRKACHGKTADDSANSGVDSTL